MILTLTLTPFPIIIAWVLLTFQARPRSADDNHRRVGFVPDIHPPEVLAIPEQLTLSSFPPVGISGETEPLAPSGRHAELLAIIEEPAGLGAGQIEGAQGVAADDR